jgi:hypothetical protein|uniref:Rad50 zinc hook motif n=1 Tax=Myoviridae sp. ctsip2 TaxID=2826705 RepID=A0A8S5N6H8_9CAUD|nr:MAG TPA: Rad50 zinc hook motif [Myoviridae sp. ctsip2]
MNTPRYVYHGKLCPVCQIDFEQNIILIKTDELKKRVGKLRERKDCGL